LLDNLKFEQVRETISIIITLIHSNNGGNLPL
jgi:hypothetical protein